MRFLKRFTHLYKGTGLLAWPAWQRALAVLPLLGLLWWAVAWALQEAAPL